MQDWRWQQSKKSKTSAAPSLGRPGVVKDNAKTVTFPCQLHAAPAVDVHLISSICSTCIVHVHWSFWLHWCMFTRHSSDSVPHIYAALGRCVSQGATVVPLRPASVMTKQL